LRIHESLGYRFGMVIWKWYKYRVLPVEEAIDSPYDQPQDAFAFAPSSEHRKVADETPDTCICIIIPNVSGRFTVSFATVPLKQSPQSLSMPAWSSEVWGERTDKLSYFGLKRHTYWQPQISPARISWRRLFLSTYWIGISDRRFPVTAYLDGIASAAAL